MKRSIKSLLLAVLCMPCAIYGQTPMPLDSLYTRADALSVNLQTFRTALECADKEVAIAKATRLPDIQGEASVGYLADGLLSNRNFSSWQHIDNPHFMNLFAIKAQQVIYAGGSISRGIEVARMGKQMAELDLQKNRQDIRFVIASCYLDLCRLENRRRVIEKNIELNKRITEDITAKYAHGTALKTDITRYELEQKRLELELTKVDNATKVTSRQLAIMLHLPEEELIKPDIASVDKGGNANSEVAWQTLVAGNNSLKQAVLAAEIEAQKVKLEKATLKPTIAAVAELHFDGPITNEVPVIDKNIGYWFAGIGVRYNISSLLKGTKRVNKAKTAWQYSKEKVEEVKEEMENAVQTAFTAYQTAVKELDIQKKSVELANQNYAVVSNRYHNGLALLTDMLDASNAKLSADLNAADAEINIIFHKIKLNYICHTL